MQKKTSLVKVQMIGCTMFPEYGWISFASPRAVPNLLQVISTGDTAGRSDMRCTQSYKRCMGGIRDFVQGCMLDTCTVPPLQGLIIEWLQRNRTVKGVDLTVNRRANSFVGMRRFREMIASCTTSSVRGISMGHWTDSSTRNESSSQESSDQISLSFSQNCSCIIYCGLN